MTYAAALAFLDSLIAADRPRPPYSEVKLARMRHLLGLIGDPHRRVKSVLVAGTKGKGSTAVMLIRCPNTWPDPARTPLTTSTPGTLRSACSEAMDVGVKPFSEVSA